MEILDLSKKNQKIVKFSFLKESIGGDSGAKVLDIGCGDGEFLLTLKKFFPAMEYYGCDILPMGEKISKEIIFCQVDLNAGKLQYPDNFFDTVIIIDLLEHILNPEKVLGEARRILKKGGKCFLHIPTEKEPFIFYRIFCELTKTEYKRDIGKHIQCFRRKEILNFLKNNNFTPVSIRYNYHLIGGLRDTLKYMLATRQQKAKKIDKFPRGKDDLALLTGRFGRIIFLALDFLSYYESKILSRVPFGAMAMSVYSRV